MVIAAVLAASLIGVAFAQETAPQNPPQLDGSLAQPDSAVWQAQLEAARLRHEDWLACIQARRFKCETTAKPDPMDALLNDDTLVAGDIVSTPEGLKIFRGSSQTPHSPADFR